MIIENRIVVYLQKYNNEYIVDECHYSRNGQVEYIGLISTKELKEVQYRNGE